MLKVFGEGLLPQGSERPRYNAGINLFEFTGELQMRMAQAQPKHPIVEAYVQEIKGYSEKGPMEFCAFENAAKGLVIRSLLRSHAESNLTLLTGGGQASVLEAAACLVLEDVDPQTELA